MRPDEFEERRLRVLEPRFGNGGARERRPQRETAGQQPQQEPEHRHELDGLVQPPAYRAADAGNSGQQFVREKAEAEHLHAEHDAYGEAPGHWIALVVIVIVPVATVAPVVVVIVVVVVIAAVVIVVVVAIAAVVTVVVVVIAAVVTVVVVVIDVAQVGYDRAAAGSGTGC